MKRIILSILVHLVITLIIVMTSIVFMVFFYDYSVLHIVISFIFGCVLILTDFIICKRMNNDKPSINYPMVIHGVDLFLLIPQLIFLLVCLLPLKASYSLHEMCLNIGIILIDILLVTERLLLAKSIKRRFSNRDRLES